MSFKTILAHIAEDEAGRKRLDAAAALAQWREARLIGVALAATPAPFVADGTVGLSAVWAEASAEAETRANALVGEFEREMAGRGVKAEARVIAGYEEMAAEMFATAARHADLSILGGRDGCATRSLADALIERALFDSGRPALLIPAAGWDKPIGVRVALAWDGGAQAARAAGDALPFLAGADSVRVLVAEGASDTGDEPGADVAAWLTQHGVSVEVTPVAVEGRSIADAINAEALAAESDLLVMGGYGHSRLRESLFGGVTTSMLDAPALPIFMSR